LVNWKRDGRKTAVDNPQVLIDELVFNHPADLHVKGAFQYF